MYRISRNGQEPIVDVDTVDDIEPAIRDFEAGRYDVDEISAHPVRSGHISRRWGTVIKWRDGTVFLEPDPLPGSQ